MQEWTFTECVLQLITVKSSCNMLFCCSYSFGETQSHKVSFAMQCYSGLLGEYAASGSGRGQQGGSVNTGFDSVFLCFLLFSSFLFLILFTQYLNRVLSLVKMLYDQVVSRQAAVMPFQMPTYGDP